MRTNGKFQCIAMALTHPEGHYSLAVRCKDELDHKDGGHRFETMEEAGLRAVAETLGLPESALIVEWERTVPMISRVLKKAERVGPFDLLTMRWISQDEWEELEQKRLPILSWADAQRVVCAGTDLHGPAGDTLAPTPVPGVAHPSLGTVQIDMGLLPRDASDCALVALVNHLGRLPNRDEIRAVMAHLRAVCGEMAAQAGNK